MFPLKLMRSIVFGDNISSNNPLFLSQNHHFFHLDNLDDSDDNPDCNNILTKSRNRIPLMLFIPTQELVKDTYRVATIARAIGMDLKPNPSLSHIIFSWSSPPPPPPPPPSSSQSSSSSTSSSSHSWSLPDDSVPLPFPSFATASLSHLRLFANFSKGYFKLVFLKSNYSPHEKIEYLSNNNWHCTSLSLFFTRTGERIKSMDGFSKALLGMGWTLFKTNCDDKTTADSFNNEVYLYRKLDANRICNTKQLINRNGDAEGNCRVRELRLLPLDFRNAPLRILQYILLMTDDMFYLA